MFVVLQLLSMKYWCTFREKQKIFRKRTFSIVKVQRFGKDSVTSLGDSERKRREDKKIAMFSLIFPEEKSKHFFTVKIFTTKLFIVYAHKNNVEISKK